MIFLVVVFFPFILLEVHSVSWIYMMSFFTFRKCSVSISSNSDSEPFSLFFPSGTLITHTVELFIVINHSPYFLYVCVCMYVFICMCLCASTPMYVCVCACLCACSPLLYAPTLKNLKTNDGNHHMIQDTFKKEKGT